MSRTTFKARNNHVVSVDGRLWGLSQSMIIRRPRGRLKVEDACTLIRAVDPEGDLVDQKRTLKHIRRYFRWSEPGGKALNRLITRAGTLRWTPEGVDIAISELAKK